MPLNNNHTNHLLGLPPDARLLIINADDFGVCHAVNEAIIRTLHEGLVYSTTLMVPCPWALHLDYRACKGFGKGSEPLPKNQIFTMKIRYLVTEFHGIICL